VLATTGVVYNKLDQRNPKTLLIMVRLNNLQIRTAALYDRVPLAHLQTCLWPELSSDEHARELRAAEAWARAQGCREMASDASIENRLSQRVHEASGFTVTARSILYRKSL
jgi:hypothetical protein